MKVSLSSLLHIVTAVSLAINVENAHGLSASVATTTTTTSGTFSSLPSLADFNYHENSRLPYLEEGYGGTWKWQGHDINYLELGDPSNPPLLLIHGFGASVYHFRYNIPNLARNYHVYAFDLLGFGGSSKPIQEYGPQVWRDQTLDFIEQIIQRPTAVAGNSLGGFTALYAASSEAGKKLITSCISLNGAGRFRDPETETTDVDQSIAKEEEKNMMMSNFFQGLKRALERFVIGLSFIYTKQPARIEQVLRQVYPVNADNVDAELVRSIQLPSFDPNAPEVFYRVITKTAGASVTIDDCLETLECPLLLCWGEQDPWIRSAAADRMQLLYPAASRISIDAGHCPHDEAPQAVNDAIRQFIASTTMTTTARATATSTQEQ